MEIFGFDGIPLTWILAIGALTLFYVYGKWRNRVLKDNGIPGPEPYIYIGNLPQIFSKGVDFDNTDGKKYGKVFGAFLGGVPMINVSDPDIAREILIKQFDNFMDRVMVDLSDHPIDKGILIQKGETWRRLRNIVSPTFSGSKLRVMCDKINECAKTLTTNFLKAGEKNADVNLREYFGAFSMDVISSAAFGIEMDSQNDTSNVFVKEAKRVLGETTAANPPMMIAMIFPGLTPLFKALGFSVFPKGPVKLLSKLVAEMIEKRKNDPSKEKRTDFLQLLIDAEDDGMHDDVTQSDQSKKSKKMSHDEMLGQALLFFVAGYETTANTLHFAAYSLATNPDVQQRLVEEVDNVLGEREPNYDNINELTYLDHVITETLRLYPVVPVVNRTIKNTVKIKGYTFPKECTVSFPTLTIHRDPDIYPDPHEFIPDRWDRKSEMDAMNYLPFGHGPRHCVGMRLAQVEMKIALAQVLKKLTFVPAPDTPERLTSADMKITAALSTKKTLYLRVKSR